MEPMQIPLHVVQDVDCVRFDVLVPRRVPEVTAESTPRYNVHDHTSFELIYNLYDGAHALCDDHLLEMGRGQFLLVAPGVYHTFLPRIDSPHPFAVRFTMKRLNQPEHPVFAAEPLLTAQRYRLVRDACGMLDIIEKIWAEAEQRQRGYAECISGYTGVLLRLMLRNLHGHDSAAEEDGAAKGQMRIERIDDFFASEFCGNVHAPDLAALLGVGVRQLERVLLSVYRCTFRQKLTDVRIKKACELLKSSDVDLTLLARLVGYQSQKAFYMMFVDRIGMSPSEYRVRNQPQGEQDSAKGCTP